MARVREKLSKAPVTEAVLDFRTRLPEEASLAALKTAVAGLAGSYPNVEEVWLWQGSVAITPQSEGPVSTSSRTPNGFFARTSDLKQVAQFRLDGFTYSRLAPYTSWREVSVEAFRLWEIYREASKPSALYRVAVRYINRIRLPEETVDFDDILFSAPQVPKEFPQVLGGFLTRVVVPMPSPNTQAHIVQAYNAPPAAGLDSILLDVDVVRNEELDLAVPKLQSVFEDLRVFKNQAFFGSLTEDMVGKLE